MIDHFALKAIAQSMNFEKIKLKNWSFLGKIVWILLL